MSEICEACNIYFHDGGRCALDEGCLVQAAAREAVEALGALGKTGFRLTDRDEHGNVELEDTKGHRIWVPTN